MTPDADQARAEDGDSVLYAEESLGDVDGEIVLLMAAHGDSLASSEASPLWAGNLDSWDIWLRVRHRLSRGA